jgi:hypothetical protein
VTTATAVAREAAWLRTSGDTLPALLTSAGGPWQVVQGYWPGARFAAKQTGVYVLRHRLIMPRFGGRRIMPGYQFDLRAIWPVKTATSPVAETEQQNFDNAIDQLLQRIDGLPGDKSHGGRFLSAGEGLEGTAVQGLYPVVDFADPAVTIPQDGWLRAVISYPANDPEILG